jgi:predicted dehydrogenase
LIGCGFVSQYHLDGWKRIPGVEIVAICDTDPDRLRLAGVRMPGARPYDNPKTLYDREALDFVDISTRPDTHRVLVEQAARHGAHVICQKPAALERAELVAMIESCEIAGVRLMIHENWRFRPWYRTIRAEIVAGTVGRLTRLRIAHRDTRALRPDGFSTQPFLTSMPKMILMEMGCHLVDTARYLFGEIHAVSANLGQFGGRTSGEDVAMLQVRFAGGELGSLDMSWCTPPEVSRPEWALNETVVEGDAGVLKLQTDGSILYVDIKGRTEPRPVRLPPDDEVYVEGFVATQRHFIDGIVHGTPHETSGSDTLRTMDVVWAAYRSAFEGIRVPL